MKAARPRPSDLASLAVLLLAVVAFLVLTI